MAVVSPSERMFPSWLWGLVVIIVFCALGWGIYRYILPSMTAQPAEINQVTVDEKEFAKVKPLPNTSSWPTAIPMTTPSSSPVSTISIKNVQVSHCTAGSSCFGWLTNISVTGAGFATDSRVKLLLPTQVYSGSHVGGDSSATILTDFTDLPRCSTFDITVYGGSGTVTKPNAVSTICP